MICGIILTTSYRSKLLPVIIQYPRKLNEMKVSKTQVKCKYFKWIYQSILYTNLATLRYDDGVKHMPAWIIIIGNSLWDQENDRQATTG